VERPRQRIVRIAQQAVDQRQPSKCVVHFTFVCASCGALCVIEDANVLYESGTCFRCGETTRIGTPGFVLLEV